MPSGEDLILSYVKDGFVSKLHMFPADGSLLVFYFQHQTWYETAVGMLGGQLDFTKAMLTPQSAGNAGLKFELDPPNGVGPIYGDDITFEFDQLLTETTSLGVAAFVNVTPGDYRITYDTTKSCTTTASWMGDVPNTVDVKARAGFLTFVGMKCL